MPLVFDAKPDSGYDDHPGERYHFPNCYLMTARGGVGDWVVYRKPRRGDGEDRVFRRRPPDRDEADLRDANSSYARVDGYPRLPGHLRCNGPEDCQRWRAI